MKLLYFLSWCTMAILDLEDSPYPTPWDIDLFLMTLPAIGMLGLTQRLLIRPSV